MKFCIVPGAQLHDCNVIGTEISSNINRCVTLCTASEECLSANYQKSTGICILNAATEIGNGNSFQKGLGADYIHFTSKKCYSD